jgi:microcystin-dependent protein
MATTPPILEFLVTDIGLEKAQEAANTGIRVVLSTYALGSSSGYTATKDQKKLQGDILFSDTITRYSNLADGSLMLECTVGDQVGTFEFGEVGIYTDTGALFAVCVFPNPLIKYSSLGTGVNSTYTFNAYLKLAQASAVFNVTSYLEPSIIYGSWASVLPPSYLSTSANTYVVTDLDKKGDVTTLTQKAVNGVLAWSIQGNYFALPIQPTIVATDRSYIDISLADWAAMIPDADNIPATVDYSAGFNFVVEATSNYFRAVASIAIVGNNVRLTLTAPFTQNTIDQRQTIKLWVNDSSLLKRSEENWLQFQLSKLVADLNNLGQILRPGDITIWTGTTARTGCLECNGAALSRTTYAALFAAIGTTFGAGNGSTTFNIPDLRGVFIRGWDHGRGLDGGRGLGSYQADTFGYHGHNAYVNDPGHNHNYDRIIDQGGSSYTSGDRGMITLGTSWAGTGISVDIGGSGSNETKPKNVALMYCIKY